MIMQVLGEQYAAIRRTRGDGNCFFRSFMFSYLVCCFMFLLEQFWFLLSGRLPLSFLLDEKYYSYLAAKRSFGCLYRSIFWNHKM